MSKAHSPTIPSLHLRHNSFSNLSVALLTSQHILQPFRRFTMSQFILQPFFRFSYVTSSSLNSPGEPAMLRQQLFIVVGCNFYRLFIEALAWFNIGIFLFIINPLLPELRKNILIFFNVILFRMGRKIYMIFLKNFNLIKNLLYEGNGRLARWIKWGTCDVREAKVGLELNMRTLILFTAMPIN